MKWYSILGALVVTLGIAGQAHSYDLLDLMLGTGCGCAKRSCCDKGCAAKASCGAAKATCGCAKGCAAKATCGAAKASCGAAKSCGCAGKASCGSKCGGHCFRKRSSCCGSKCSRPKCGNSKACCGFAGLKGRCGSKWPTG